MTLDILPRNPTDDRDHLLHCLPPAAPPQPTSAPVILAHEALLDPAHARTPSQIQSPTPFFYPLPLAILLSPTHFPNPPRTPTISTLFYPLPLTTLLNPTHTPNPPQISTPTTPTLFTYNSQLLSSTHNLFIFTFHATPLLRCDMIHVACSNFCSLKMLHQFWYYYMIHTPLTPSLGPTTTGTRLRMRSSDGAVVRRTWEAVCVTSHRWSVAA